MTAGEHVVSNITSS